MGTQYEQTWNLNVFFSGGSSSPLFLAFLDTLENDVTQFARFIDTNIEQLDQTMLCKLVVDLQQLRARLLEASAFIGCLEAQDVKDEKAKILLGRISQLFADYESAMTVFDKQLTVIDDQTFSLYLQTKELEPVAFALTEQRQQALLKLPADQEGLVNALAVDGYHGWEDLYSTVVGQMSLRLDVDGEAKEISIGQASNLLSHADRSVRRTVFGQLTGAWDEQAELCATALNHLAGFRLNVYQKRGWTEVLKEPLFLNRMSEQTLASMWSAIDYARPKLVEYLVRKARLIGVDQLSWYDLEAPLAKETQSVRYDVAAQFIIDRFAAFSPDMAELAETALRNQWVESEDRPGKRPGGFCTDFALSKQSRIFMTYSGSPQSVSTLAHELGHAYHGYVVRDLPILAGNYAMNVAETASTFAELIVSNAAIKHAESPADRLALLEDKVQSSVAFFMNIYARFLFETRFYQARSKGQLTVNELNEMMLAAQREAYGDALADYHPQFWASKLHFYITDVPFYNFPYTFGYLFSTGVYARALVEGAEFATKYRDLLRDTGQMPVEDLARKHLGVDIQSERFWLDGVRLIMQDVDQFLDLTKLG